MSLFRRFLMYKVDCLIMLMMVGVQYFLYRGDLPVHYDADHWLRELLPQVGQLWLFTTLAGALYWTIVDYHPTLEQYRKSRIVMREDGSELDLGTRFVRSFVKSFTIFSFQGLMLYGLFNEQRRFAHDDLTKSHRVAL